LHNWSDKYCIQILRHLVAAMKPSSKIIVNDAVIVEPTGTTAEQYWMMRFVLQFFCQLFTILLRWIIVL
jgi:hypothetical protein